MKRLLDISLSIAVLVAASPVLLVFILLVWLQDFKSPFYTALRVGIGGRLFRIIKLRSMVVSADKIGATSTTAADSRITPIGYVMRRFKIDEITQFWNVLTGSMSVIGPRPQVADNVDTYTSEEQRLLSVKPGITDLASIVFSDEGDILKDSADPDLDYNRLIRPWKSRLGLFCIDHSSLALDMRLVMLTAVAILNRPRALVGAQSLLKRLGADDDLIRVASRTEPLTPALPPGATQAAAAQGGV